MTPAVSAAARIRDLVALTLLLIGAGLYVYAHAGMGRLVANQVQLASGEYYMNRWNEYRTMSNIGLAIAGAGIAAGVLSFMRHSRTSRAADAPPAP